MAWVTAGADKKGSEIFLNLHGFAGSPTVVLRRNRFESASSIDSLGMMHVFINGDLTTEIFGDEFEVGTTRMWTQ